MRMKVRPPEESPYAAMTVNERLFEAGLLEQFDSAAYAYDDARMREILARVDLGDEAADGIINWVKTSPHSMYRRRNSSQ